MSTGYSLRFHVLWITLQILVFFSYDLRSVMANFHFTPYVSEFEYASRYHPSKNPKCGFRRSANLDNYFDDDFARFRRSPEDGGPIGQEPSIEVRAILVRCPKTEEETDDILVNRNIYNISAGRSQDILDFHGFDRDEPSLHSQVRDCRRKLVITMKFNNIGKTKTQEQFVVIDHVLDPVTMHKSRLLNPFVVKVRQEPILQLYGLKFRGVVNAEAKEEVINNKQSNYTGCDDSSENPTCGQMFFEDKPIPHSQGFCCSCDPDVNTQRESSTTNDSHAPSYPSFFYKSRKMLIRPYKSIRSPDASLLGDPQDSDESSDFLLKDIEENESSRNSKIESPRNENSADNLERDKSPEDEERDLINLKNSKRNNPGAFPVGDKSRGADNLSDTLDDKEKSIAETRGDEKLPGAKRSRNIIDELTKLEEDYENFRKSSMNLAEDTERNDGIETAGRTATSGNEKYFNHGLNSDKVKKFDPIERPAEKVPSRSHADDRNSISNLGENFSRGEINREPPRTVIASIKFDFKPRIFDTDLSNISMIETNPPTDSWTSETNPPRVLWQSLSSDKVYPSQRTTCPSRANKIFSLTTESTKSTNVTGYYLKIHRDLHSKNTGQKTMNGYPMDVRRNLKFAPKSDANNFRVRVEGSSRTENSPESSSGFSRGKHTGGNAIALSGSLRNQLGNWLTYDKQRVESSKNYEEEIESRNGETGDKRATISIPKKFDGHENREIPIGQRPREIFLNWRYDRESSDSSVPRKRSAGKFEEGFYFPNEKMDFLRKKYSMGSNLPRNHRSIAEDEKLVEIDNDRQKTIDKRIDDEFVKISNVLKDASEGSKIIQEKPSNDETFEKDDSLIQRFASILEKNPLDFKRVQENPREFSSISDTKGNEKIESLYENLPQNFHHRVADNDLIKVQESPKEFSSISDTKENEKIESLHENLPQNFHHRVPIYDSTNEQIRKFNFPLKIDSNTDIQGPNTEKPIFQKSEPKMIIDRFRISNEYQTTPKIENKMMQKFAVPSISLNSEKLSKNNFNPTTPKISSMPQKEINFPATNDKLKIPNSSSSIFNIFNSHAKNENPHESESNWNKSFEIRPETEFSNDEKSKIPTALNTIENLKNQLHDSSKNDSPWQPEISNFEKDKNSWKSRGTETKTETTLAEKMEDGTLPADEETSRTTNSHVVTGDPIEIIIANTTEYPRFLIRNMVNKFPAKEASKLFLLLEEKSPLWRFRKREKNNRRGNKRPREEEPMESFKKFENGSELYVTKVPEKLENSTISLQKNERKIPAKGRDIDWSINFIPVPIPRLDNKLSSPEELGKVEASKISSPEKSLQLPAPKFRSFYPKSSEIIAMEREIAAESEKNEERSGRQKSRDIGEDSGREVVFYDYEDMDGESSDETNFDGIKRNVESDEDGLNDALNDGLRPSEGWKEKMELLKLKKHADVLKEYLNWKHNVAPPEPKGIIDYTNRITEKIEVEEESNLSTSTSSMSDAIPEVVTKVPKCKKKLTTVVDDQSDQNESTEAPFCGSEQTVTEKDFKSRESTGRILPPCDSRIECEGQRQSTREKTSKSADKIDDLKNDLVIISVLERDLMNEKQKNLQNPRIYRIQKENVEPHVRNLKNPIRDLDDHERGPGRKLMSVIDGMDEHDLKKDFVISVLEQDLMNEKQNNHLDSKIYKMEKENIEPHVRNLKNPIRDLDDDKRGPGRKLMSVLDEMNEYDLKNDFTMSVLERDLMNEKQSNHLNSRIYKMEKENIEPRVRNVKNPIRDFNEDKRGPGRKLMSVLDEMNEHKNEDSKVYDDSDYWETNNIQTVPNISNYEGNNSEISDLKWNDLISKIISSNSSNSSNSTKLDNEDETALKQLPIRGLENYINKMATKIIRGSKFEPENVDDRSKRKISSVGRKLSQYSDNGFKSKMDYRQEDPKLRLGTKNDAPVESIQANAGRDFAISLTGKIHLEGGTNGQPVSISFDTSQDSLKKPMTIPDNNTNIKVANITKPQAGNFVNPNVLSSLFNIVPAPKEFDHHDERNPNFYPLQELQSAHDPQNRERVDRRIDEERARESRGIKRQMNRNYYDNDRELRNVDYAEFPENYYYYDNYNYEEDLDSDDDTGRDAEMDHGKEFQAPEVQVLKIIPVEISKSKLSPMESQKAANGKIIASEMPQMVTDYVLENAFTPGKIEPAELPFNTSDEHPNLEIPISTIYPEGNQPREPEDFPNRQSMGASGLNSVNRFGNLGKIIPLIHVNIHQQPGLESQTALQNQQDCNSPLPNLQQDCNSPLNHRQHDCNSPLKHLQQDCNSTDHHKNEEIQSPCSDDQDTDVEKMHLNDKANNEEIGKPCGTEPPKINDADKCPNLHDLETPKTTPPEPKRPDSDAELSKPCGSNEISANPPAEDKSRNEIRIKNMMAIIEFIQKMNKLMSCDEEIDFPSDHNKAIIKLQKIIILPIDRSNGCFRIQEKPETTTHPVVVIGEGVKHESPCNPKNSKHEGKITKLDSDDHEIPSLESDDSNKKINSQDQTFLFSGITENANASLNPDEFSEHLPSAPASKRNVSEIQKNESDPLKTFDSKSMNSSSNPRETSMRFDSSKSLVTNSKRPENTFSRQSFADSENFESKPRHAVLIKRKRPNRELSKIKHHGTSVDEFGDGRRIFRSKLSGNILSQMSNEELQRYVAAKRNPWESERVKRRRKKKRKRKRARKKLASKDRKNWWPFKRQLMNFLGEDFDPRLEERPEHTKIRKRILRRIPYGRKRRKSHGKKNRKKKSKKKSKKRKKSKKPKGKRNKRQINPGGTQTRGGQNCMDRRHPSNVDPVKYLESSHCLRFSDLWYSSYELENPIMEHTVYLQLFEKHTLADGTTHWDDLTQGTMVRMGTFTRHQRDDKPTIVFTYTGARTGSQQRAMNLDPARQRLLVPSPVPPNKASQYPSVQGSGEYLVVQTSAISKDGKECDKAGVSFAAFARQDDRCGRAKGSCLKNQPLAYWRHDMEARNSGRRGCYFLSNFASVPANPIKYNVSGGGSREYLGLEYHSAHVSAIDIEVRTDYNAIVRVGSSGRVTEVYVDSTSAEHTVVTVVISNMGLASSPYQPRITDCPTGLPVSWTRARGIMQVIPPQHDQRVTLDLYGQLLLNGFHCSVEIVNHEGELVAMRRIRVQKMDRCFCVWHCLCACIGSVSGIGCQPMSPEHYHAAGFQGPVPIVTSESSSLLETIKEILMLSALVVLLLLILGLLKWLIGLVAPPVGRAGLHTLLGGRRIEKYLEPELQCRCVITDDEGYPVHPDTGQRTVRLCTKKLEFILNFIFFLTYPIAVCSGWCRYKLRSNRQCCCSDESKMCLINEKSSCPRLICVNTYGETRDSRLEAEDTKYVMNELKKSQESLQNPRVGAKVGLRVRKRDS